VDGPVEGLLLIEFGTCLVVAIVGVGELDAVRRIDVDMELVSKRVTVEVYGFEASDDFPSRIERVAECVQVVVLVADFPGMSAVVLLQGFVDVDLFSVGISGVESDRLPLFYVQVP
jgi:hypothetical protein